METILTPLIDGAAFIATRWLHILPIDILRYAVGAGGTFLLVNILLAGVLAGRKIRQRRPDTAQMLREIAFSMRTAAVFALIGAVFIVGGREIGVISIDLTVGARGWLYFGVNVAALIVLHDAWFYWTHRLLHHPRVFRRAHRVHHKSKNPSPFTAYSFDTVEAVINAIYLPIALFLIPSSALAIFVFLVHMIVRNAVGHCGYEIFPQTRDGRPLIDWMTTVTHHDLHHAQAGWNFGLYFTWWDRVMGTEHPLYHEKFSQAVGTPLDGSAVQAMRSPAPIALLAAVAVFAAGFGATTTRAVAEEAPPTVPAGVYATQGHGAHVRFAWCADAPEKLCGTMVWSWDPELIAKNNAATFLGDFEWDEDHWAGGWLTNPEDGRTYRGKITPQANGALRLKGCAFVFCQTQIWRPVGDIPGCVVANTNIKKAGRNTPPGFFLIAN